MLPSSGLNILEILVRSCLYDMGLLYLLSSPGPLIPAAHSHSPRRVFQPGGQCARVHGARRAETEADQGGYLCTFELGLHLNATIFIIGRSEAQEATARRMNARSPEGRRYAEL